MSKSGQARVITPEQFQNLMAVIATKRHPEKNSALMLISYKLGLRVQEIALLQIKEIAKLSPQRSGVARDFTLHEIMSLPAAYTKGADAMNRSKSEYQRRAISFSIDEFDKVVMQIEQLARAGAKIDPSTFYPPVKKHKGKSRDLPLADTELRKALETYLNLRLTQDPHAKPSDPLFLSQKGVAYSPNTLQEHMALMQREWAGIEKASSHSGRRTLITNIIHTQGKSLKVAQKIAGHVSPATTVIYEDPPELAITTALVNAGKHLENF